MACSSPASARHEYTQPGHLRIGVLRDLDNLNPLLSNEAAVTDVAQLIFSGLVRVDDRGEVIPDAALAVPTARNGGISADGRTITYHLRPDLRFADGVPVRASDVAFTLRQMANPRNNVPNRFPYDRVVRLDVPDAHTVVVRLAEPFAPFVAAFFPCTVQGVILPEHLLGASRDFNRDPFNAKPVGSGPFAVTAYEPGSRIEMVANRFWRGGRPKLDRITYRIIPNENSLLVALRAHEIDLWESAPETALAQLRGLPGVRTSAVPFAQFEMVVFNTRREPFDDVRVRRAVVRAIDWAAIARTAYLDVDLPDWGDIFPLSWAFTPQADPNPYDPGAASALLSAAGWIPGPNGVRVKGGRPLEATITTVAGATTRERVELLMQQYLRAAGMDLHVRNAPASVLFAPKEAGGLLSGGKFDLTLYAWLTRADPDDTLTAGPDSIAPKGSNDSGLVDAEIGRLQRAATRTYDRATRKALYARLERRLGLVLPYRTIVWRADIMAWNDDLRGVRPAHLGSGFWNVGTWSI